MKKANLQIKDSIIEKKTTINCNGRILDLSLTKIMGVLNVTPDSFYDGNKHNSNDKILSTVNKMIEQGVDIIDVGAMSSRPGAKIIDEQTEAKRLFPVLELLNKNFPDLIISVDTLRANIADESISNYNVSIINDISAGDFDNKMFNIIAKYNVPYIIMHMKGLPDNMQNNTNYTNVVDDIIKYFTNKIYKLKNLRINDIIIDPGFGFGKTLEQNYYLLKKLDNFKVFNLPVLVGLSRKSMIYNLLDISPNDALNGTSILNFLSLQNGANILRVHDVKEAKQAVKLFNKINFLEF